jgi:hypothetical protein
MRNFLFEQTVSPLVTSKEVSAMVSQLQEFDQLQESSQRHYFKYGTLDEIICYRVERLSEELSKRYNQLIEKVISQAVLVRNYPTLLSIWKHHAPFREIIANWFDGQVQQAESLYDLEELILFIPPGIDESIVKRLSQFITATTLIGWSYREWVLLERMVGKPEKEDPKYLHDAYTWSQKLFEQTASQLDPVSYLRLQGEIVSPISFKFGGTDLSKFFRRNA